MKIFKKTKKFFKDLYLLNNEHGGFHQDEARLRQKYSSPTKICEQRPFSVIVCVDGAYPQGGLSDRIRGIVSIYHFCKQHHLPFFIHFTYPFDLKDYLQPNQYNWYISPEEISHNAEEAEPMLLFCHLLNHKFHRQYLEKRIKKAMATRKQLHIYTNTFIEDQHFTKDFNELFTCAPRLQELVDQTCKMVGDHYISVSFRFQNLLGDFQDDCNEELSENEKQILIDKCIRKVAEIHDTQFPSSQVLVAGDSKRFIEATQEALPYAITIPGNVVHVDYALEADYYDYAKVFIDWFVLSHAQKLFLLKTGKMYKGGFAKRASKITGAPYEEFFF